MTEIQKILTIKSLTDKLELSGDETLHEYLADLAHRNKLREVLSFYDSIQNEEEKFVMMEILIQVANDLFQLKGQIGTWEMIEQRLVWDFDIHKQTVKDWACPGNDARDLCGPITQDMKELLDRSKLPGTRILFVCTINLMRSATAHQIYSNDLRFEVRSAGTHRSARTVISKNLLDWAEVVIVMEDHHLRVIRKMYSGITGSKTIACFDVPDNYDYMQSELITLLRFKVEDFFRSGLPFQ